MVVFDTAPLVWGLRKESNPKEIGMIASARDYLESLRKRGKKAAIPAPVLAELIFGLPKSKHTRFYNKVKSRFPVLPFDALSAKIAAELDWKAIQKNAAGNHQSRQALKIDAMIAACAVRYEAETLLTADRDLELYRSLLAKYKIRIAKLPKVNRLFDPHADPAEQEPK